MPEPGRPANRGVDDIGAPNASGKGQRGLGQHGKADVIIGVILAGFSVQSRPVKKDRAFQEIERHFAFDQVKRGVEATRGQPDRQRVVDAAGVFEIDAGVTRHEHRYVVPEGLQGGRQ